MSKEQKSKSHSYWRVKSIRDPLYGFIGLTEPETKLIGTRPFLKLQRIKQISHAYQVYPTAVHTRFEHSLGVLHLADRICNALDFDDERREVVRSAALLHDIGHGPFSHLFEEFLKRRNPETKFSHENITRWIVNENPEISDALGSRKGDVLDLLSERKEPRREERFDSLAADIISSGIDADKLDYLRRDSYHIGVAYGSFDLERIIYTISGTPDGRSICIGEKGKDAVENYRLGRYLMHAQVYEHHTRIVADQMFLRALEIAIEEKTLAEDDFKLRPEKVDHTSFLKNYLELDDNSIYDKIISQGGKSKESSRMLRDIKERRLLKRACEFEPGLDIADGERRREITRMKDKHLEELRNHLASRSNTNPDLIIPHLLTISIKLYGDEILVLRKNNIPEDLSRASPMRADPPSITKFYIFCPSGKQEEIAKAAASYWNVPFEKIAYAKWG